MTSGYRGAGVYVFRTRRPGLIGRLHPAIAPAATLVSLGVLLLQGWWWPAGLLPLLFNSRHFAYVGESTAVRLRKNAHLFGGGKWKAEAKPWSDLAPSWYFLPLPRFPKWALRSIETVGILLFWPVYNHSKNLWNPRRIPLSAAKWQRSLRERAGGWSFNFRPIHIGMWALVLFVLIMKGWS